MPRKKSKEFIVSIYKSNYSLVFNHKGFELFKKKDNSKIRVSIETNHEYIIASEPFLEDSGCIVNLKGKQPRINLGEKVFNELRIPTGTYKVTQGDTDGFAGNGYVFIINLKDKIEKKGR